MSLPPAIDRMLTPEFLNSLPSTAKTKLLKLLQDRRLIDVREDHSADGHYDEDGIRQGGLMAFVRYFWDILEPGRTLVDGWPLWAMVEHLEAVTRGDITRLLINVPPGFMKSLLVDVFWPAWEWGPKGCSHYRYVAFSYSASLTERDNFRFRMLVSSPRYQALYGPIKTKLDRTEEPQFDEAEEGFGLINKTIITVKNSKSGWKLSSSVGGVGTGERGDRIIIDDPHNVKESESAIVRGETIRWFRESISNRFNDLDRGALIIIMQRVHEDDVSGIVLQEGFDYCHLMVPWSFEAGRQEPTVIGWVDPRLDEEEPDKYDGEPAWPERFSEAAMERTQQEVGPYAWASQYQQSPAPRGGGIFERLWWQLWESPDGKFPVVEHVVASLDGAYTEKEENDPCALTVWGTFVDHDDKKKVILLHAWRKHLKFSGQRIPKLNALETTEHYKRRTQEHWGLMVWCKDTCDRFKADKLLIEAKAPGISAAQELQNRYGDQAWAIQLMPVKGDKVARALAVQPSFSQLLVYAPDRDWAHMVQDEMATFPKGRYDDLTDSATQAFKYLRDNGLLRTEEEEATEATERVRHRSPMPPLYDI